MNVDHVPSAKALVGLCGCTCLSEPSMLAYSVDKYQHLKSWLTNVLPYQENPNQSFSGNAEGTQKRVRNRDLMVISL